MAYMREQAQTQKRVKPARIAAVGLAATACAMLAIFVLPGLLGDVPTAEPNAVAVSSLTSDAASAQPAEQRLALGGNPVPYSSLHFGYTADTVYPDVPNQTQSMCVIAFSEDMLARSELVALTTVEDVRFHDYLSYTHTAVYTLRIDKIFYSELDVAEGDTFTVEQVLYGGCLSDSEFGLKPGGRYILPICADEGIVQEYDIDNEPHTAAKESPYSLIYPFQPMIELTADGGYLFFGDRDENGGGFGWKSLVNDETVEVVMDVETASGTDSWVTRMKLRADDRFEDDFEALVDYYCAEGSAENSGGLEAVPHGSEINGMEAILIGESALPEGLEISQESCWFDIIHREWNVHFEFNNEESAYDMRLSSAGDVMEAVWH